MLLEKERSVLESSGVMETRRATIKTTPKIFNFFADQTYANKPRAICRELVANAFDSHVMAGKPDLPVEVWLPTILEPTFRVRDHGLGMSHEFMMNDFMCYADGSTKDGSNVAIGGFGIGSKSPFAYVDQYTVRSIFDGVESAYSIFKDEEGIPSIGLLGQRATDEPNGVEVSFPVKPADFTTFEEAAFEALRYFEPLPDIKNATEGQFEPPFYVSKGKGWGMREKSGDLQIIMGGVMYPVNVDNLTYKFPSTSAARKLLKYGLDLRVPIGTCSVALSREALSYDERTVEAIRLACEGVIEEVKQSFSTMFDHIENEWDAAVALHAEVGDSGYGQRAEFLKENAMWCGQPLSIDLDFPKLAPLPDNPELLRFGYDVWKIESAWDRRGRGGKTKPIGSSKFETPGRGYTPAKLGAIIIDDLPQLPKHKAVKKIKEFCSDMSKAALVIRPNAWLGDAAPDVETILKGFGSPPDNIVVLTSELPEPVMERGYSKKWSNRPKVRMFTYDGSSQRSYHNWRAPELRVAPDRAGVDEIPYADQPSEGVLVVMDNFIPPEDVKEKVNSGLLSWHDLKFVNRADAKKLKGWTDYKVEFERRKKEKLSAYPELAQRIALSDASSLRTVFDFFRRNSAVDFSSRKPLGQIFNLYKRYVEPLTQEQRLLARFVEAKLPRGVKPEELQTKFMTKQRKAWRLMELLPSYLDEEDLKLFQENL